MKSGIISGFIIFLVIPGRQADFCPGFGWTKYDDRCIKLVETISSQHEASAVCPREFNPADVESPRLLEIRSEEDQEFVSHLFFNKSATPVSVWIGAVRDSRSDEFIWASDNSPINYTNWAENSPTNNSERGCVELHSEISRSSEFGQWRDVTCSKGNWVACQKVAPLTVPEMTMAITNLLRWQSNFLYDIDLIINPILDKIATLDAQQRSLETDQANLNSKQQALDTKQIALENKQKTLEMDQVALKTKQQALDAKQITLDTKQQALDTRQIALDNKQKTLETDQIALSAKQQALDTKQITLDTKQQSLDAKQIALDNKQKTLETGQIALGAKQQALDTKQITLDTKQQALDTKQITLDTKQQALDTKQTTLDTKQQALDTKQTALDSKQKTLETNYATLSAKQTAQESKLTSLQSQQTAFETNFNSLNTKVSSLETKQNSIQTTQTQMQTNHNSLQTSHNTLQTNHNALKTEVNTKVIPVGYIFVQLPFQSEPKVLWPSYTWTEVSSTYAGRFFRVVGGHAAAFGTDQTDAFQGHHHNGAYNSLGVGRTDNRPSDSLSVVTSLSAGATSTISTYSGYGAVRVASETRPINYSVRIWRRSA